MRQECIITFIFNPIMTTCKVAPTQHMSQYCKKLLIFYLILSILAWNLKNKIYICACTMKKSLLYIILIGFFSLGPLSLANEIGGFEHRVDLVDQTNPEKVMISPNPANTVTNIRNSNANVRITEIAVYSVLGSQLFQQSYDSFVDQNNIQLNVSSFKKGKYLVKIQFSDGTTEVKTLIKQ